MTLNQIRTVLLEQHNALRAQIAEARRATELWREGDWSRDDLQGRLQRLSEALRAHHACEEMLLRDVIPTIDAWGNVRAEIMTQTHLDEHRNLCAGLIGATINADADSGSTTILMLLESMLEHMKQEETYVLAADVLNDDLPVNDAFGG
jgi:hypothetical protein